MLLSSNKFKCALRDIILLTKLIHKPCQILLRPTFVILSLLFTVISNTANSSEKLALNVFKLAKVTKVKDIELKEIDTEESTFSLIEEQLTEFDIHHKESSYKHALNYMETYPNTCIRDIVKNPEREKLFIFSQPQTLILGARVYLSPNTTLNENKPINKIDEVDLVEFIKGHPDYIIAIEYERSYGEKLDNQIELIPQKNKYFIEGSSSESVLVMMVYNNKVDAIIQYPSMIYNVSRIISEKPLASYAISQGAKYQFGHIACSKTKEGQYLIDQFNKALTKVYSSPSYLSAHTRWIEQSSQKDFLQLYQQLFLNKRD